MEEKTSSDRAPRAFIHSTLNSQPSTFPNFPLQPLTEAAISSLVPMKAFPFLLLLLSLTALAEDSPVVSLLTKGDLAETKGDTRGALSLFRQAETLAPTDIGVVLRISKQYSDLIAQVKPAEASQRMAEKSMEYAQRAVALDARNAKAHLSLAISCGRMTDFVSNKAKLEYSKVIKAEALKSIELDPTDDFAWHVLGRWHFGVANVNTVLRTMAKLAYGGMPAASNEEAAKFLKKATELAPQRIMHHAELAHVYKAMGETDLAQQSWQNVLGIRAADSEDEKYQQEAKASLDTARTARGSSSGTKFNAKR